MRLVVNMSNVKSFPIKYTICESSEHEIINVTNLDKIGSLLAQIYNKHHDQIINYCERKSISKEKFTISMIYNGIIINNGLTIGECKILDWFMVSIKISYEISITVHINGTSYIVKHIDMLGVDTIDQLKNIVSSKLIVDSKNIEITSNGNSLHNDIKIDELDTTILENLTAYVSDANSNKIKRIIFIIGPTQGGKSSLSNLFYYGRTCKKSEILFPVGTGISSVTKQINIKQILGHDDIYVCDTPGFGSTNGKMEDIETHRQIYDLMYYIKGRDDIIISSILLVSRYGTYIDSCVRKTAELYMNIFKKYLYSNFTLVITDVRTNQKWIEEKEMNSNLPMSELIEKYINLVKDAIGIPPSGYLPTHTINSLPFTPTDTEIALKFRNSIIEKCYNIEPINTKHINYIKPHYVFHENVENAIGTINKAAEYNYGLKLSGLNLEHVEYSALLNEYFSIYGNNIKCICDCKYKIQNLDSDVLVNESSKTLNDEQIEYYHVSEVPTHIKSIGGDVTKIEESNMTNFHYKIKKNDNSESVIVYFFVKSYDKHKEEIQNCKDELHKCEEAISSARDRIFHQLDKLEEQVADRLVKTEDNRFETLREVMKRLRKERENELNNISTLCEPCYTDNEILRFI